LARHGVTDWNEERRYQGQNDIPLNDMGLRQAQALSVYLEQTKLDGIIASDLQRAWQTAQPIADQHNLEIQPEPRLREMCFGIFESLKYDEIKARYPEMLAAWQADYDNPPTNGETLTAFSARIQAFLDDVRQRHQDETWLLVAHGGSLRQLICQALELPPDRRWSLSMDNASISELHVYDNLTVLHRLNDISHLDETSTGSLAMSHA
jgi:alpha-ribazole phosphatase